MAKLEKEAVENAVLLKMKEDIIDQRDKKIKTLEEFIRSCDEEIKEICSQVDQEGYEVREKALKEEIARLERRYRIDEDVAEYRRSIGMHERE